MSELSGVPQSDAPLDLRAASRDLWPRDTLSWWQGTLPPCPARVFWPETAAQTHQVLQTASSQGRTVVTYGAGSGVCGGARGTSAAWVVDTKRLDAIGPLDPDARTVRVQAGVIGQHLEDWLAARGFTLGHSPSSIGCSTVGGWAAARGAGQFSSRYGVFEDMVLAMTVVTPAHGVRTVGLDGDAPEHWMDAFIGSEGTLGIITDVLLRIVPLPQTRWLRGYAFADVPTAVDAMRELMQAELWPAVLRLYDPVDTRIGGKTRPKSERTSGSTFWSRLKETAESIPALRKRMLALPLSLPTLLNSLADLASDEVLLIVGWEGEQDVVDVQVEHGRAILQRGGRDLGSGPGERWYASRHAVSYKLMPLFIGGAFADTMEVACPWSRVVPVYEAVREAVRGHALVMAHMSHLYPEGGSLYFSFAGAGDLDVYDGLWARALDAVLAAGGTTTHHHGVGRLKRSHAWREAGGTVAFWQALRNEVDPCGILNPALMLAEPDATPPPSIALGPTDGLVLVPVAGSRASRAQLVAPDLLRWPWEDVVGRPRWQRQPWQTTWLGVSGTVDGVTASIGRGPRSASGPDLRWHLCAHDAKAMAQVATVNGTTRWMGKVRLEHPWVAAQRIVRSDLRPSRLGVVDGELFVGFIGPAAHAMGALVSARVGAPVQPSSWVDVPLATGALVACDASDPRTVAVTEQTGWRPHDR